MNNKQKKAKSLLDNFFGLDQFEKYDFNEAERTKAPMPRYFKLKDILNPSPSTYILFRKWIRVITEGTLAKYGEGSSFKLYNSLLMVLAALELNITDSKIEVWEGKYPILAMLNDTNLN